MYFVHNCQLHFSFLLGVSVATAVDDINLCILYTMTLTLNVRRAAVFPILMMVHPSLLNAEGVFHRCVLSCRRQKILSNKTEK